MAIRPMLAAGSCALLLAALPAPAQERPGPWAVTVRVGAQQPARLVEPPSPVPDLAIGPSLEVGLSRWLLPWLELELAVGWNRSEAPTERYLVSSNPADPLAPLLQLSVEQRLTTVPIFASARARWPATWAVRPYLVAGGGASYADLLTSTNSASLYPTREATGWGPAFHAGIGAEGNPWRGLRLGVEARWRWAHATLQEHLRPNPNTLYSTSRSGDANLGGFGLMAAVGWAF